MNYIYDYFETIENLSSKKIQNIPGNFFDYIDRKRFKPKSILNEDEYKLEINCECDEIKPPVKKNNATSGFKFKRLRI